MLFEGIRLAKAGNTSRLCVPLESRWPAAAPAVRNFIFILPLSDSSFSFFSRAKAFKRKSAELGMWGWGSLGKAMGAKLQAPVTLVRSALLLSVSFA